MNRKIAGILILIFSILSITCSNKYIAYIAGKNYRELNKLYKQLNRELSKNEIKYENRFIIIQQIIKALYNKDIEQLNLFLIKYTNQHPEDAFNAYYLFIVAKNNFDNNAFPMAVHYFERILKNYPDLLIQNESVHFMCLKNLLKIIEEPEVKIDYYKELIARFPEKIEIGPAYFSLAKAYEGTGDWNLAMEAYQKILEYPDQTIPGHPDAHKDVLNLISLYNTSQDWTFSDLSELVTTVKTAISTQDLRLLNKCRAKVNFFALSWEQKEEAADMEFLSNFGIFLQGDVRYSEELDEDSNEKEAYLKTHGWTYRIQTWYLFFRRVNFPADPEKNGQWEWAGIFFGEKPFKGADKIQYNN